MKLLEWIHGTVWGPWTLILFLGTGLWFTLRSVFFQVRGIRLWWGKTVGTWWTSGNQDDGEDKLISPVQSACTALAATIGTGNIVGVATALTAGGAGALFWMWVSAGIGMMTAYAETWLGIRYRYRGKDGGWICGPMVYMERGMECPELGYSYAILLILVSLGMGSMVQANSLSESVRPWMERAVSDTVVGISNGAWNGTLSGVLIGIVLVILTGAVLAGGIQRIAGVAERLVPLSAGIYLLFSCSVILACGHQFPGIFLRIFQEASKPAAAGGGVLGFLTSNSLRYGLARGVFSNEAGLGSLAALHGSAEKTTPEEQGMWAMFEVFFDTIVICTLTGLVILCVTDLRQPPVGVDGAALTAWCFSQKIGKIGEVFVSCSLLVFAFATIIAWYYLGEQAVRYLAGRWIQRGDTAPFIRGYLFLYLLAVFCGCVGRVEFIWLLSDIWNGLLAFPNLLALWMLGGEVFVR